MALDLGVGGSRVLESREGRQLFVDSVVVRPDVRDGLVERDVEDCALPE